MPAAAAAHGRGALARWARFGGSLLRDGAMLDDVRRAVRRRIGSSSEFVGFRRDLAAPFPAPAAKIPLGGVRPLAPGELPELLPLGPDLPHEERWEQATRRRFFDAGFGTWHVATAAADGRPCYLICLVGPADNDRMRRYFGDAFPRLAPHEALLEGAFTPAPFRGLGVMAAATALIAERAADIGARHVVCYVGSDNAASLKGCARAGFAPDVIRREEWRLFRRRCEFRPAATRA